MIRAIKDIIPVGIRDKLRFLKHPHYSFVRLCISFSSRNLIMQGPFKGLKFDVPNFNTAMLLGTWEKELWPIIRQITDRKCSGLIIIGAAEGLYAVGLSKLLKNPQVIAFERLEEYRKLIWHLASSNDIRDLSVLGNCTRDDLQHSLAGIGSLPIIFCDVEGAEVELLDPKVVPQLQHAAVLVELHEMYAPNCEAILKKRFSETHDSKLIHGKERSLDDLPDKIKFLRFFSSAKVTVNLMTEGRPHPMSWFWFTPKRNSP